MPWLLLPFGAYLALVSAYLLAVTVGAWLYRSPRGPASGRTRFAIVIPAHNEGLGIVPTLTGLRDCLYPAAQRSIMVIADNCSDDTAAISRQHGAQVHERHDLVARGKGQALDWLLKTQAEALALVDVVVFVDADMFIDPGFLNALDAAFSASDVEVVQSRYTIANPTASWFAAFGFLSFAFVNHLRPSGRSFLGGSAGLKGSGMAFRRELILRTGWPAASVAEDLEFSKMLAFEGVRVHYVPEAVVTSNIGGQVRQVSVQQSRWEGGKMAVTLQHLPHNLRALLRKPGIILLDELLDALVPPLSILLLLIALTTAAAWALDAQWVIVIAVTTFAITALAVVTGLLQVRTPARTWMYLAATPLFVMFKVVLFVKLFLARKPAGWNRTPRDSENP
jgi:1,2-diacylglycerol 3-beta-glucosyltransferase